MKALKNTGIALVLIAAIVLIVLYFMPNQYSISHSIEIERPASAVYAQVYDFNKWGTWDPWMKLDPAAKVTIEGTPGLPGHKMSWNGKKSGSGSITVKSTLTNQLVYSELEIVKPMASKGKDIITLEQVGDKTKVTWTNSGGLTFPWGRFRGLFINKMYGKAQQDGLQTLKTFVEAQPVVPVAVADSTAKPM